MKNVKCMKEFVHYSSLNVLGMIGLSCYILADTFFIAKGLGANGLAALNLAIPIYSFIHGSGLMLGMGGATKYSILKSQNEAHKANLVFTNTVFWVSIFAIVFLSIGVFLSEPITKLLGANDAVFQMSKTYLQVILLFAPLFMWNNMLLCFVRNDGSPLLSMGAMMGGSFSNIILDYVFIFPLGMGIFGAVLATGLSPVISILILSPYFIKKENQFHFTKSINLRRMSGGIISNGLPSLVTEASSGIVMIVFNAIILYLQGNVGVAAYGIIANLSLVVMAIYTGIAQGIQPLVSKYYGLGNRSQVQAILRYALITVLMVSIVVYSGMYWGSEYIVGLFNGEQNQLLQKLATAGLKIYFTGGIFAGFNIVLSIYFTSTNYARPAHIISLLRGFLIVIPMSYLLSAVWDMKGIWFAFPATEILVAGTGIVLYLCDINGTVTKAPF